MNDMSATIVAKSDQINAADLVGISRTITIRDVKIKPGDDQPVSVLIEGDQKAFRPCKGVRRLMVRVWGADASKYVGQSMTLFQDPTVTWAGKPEGGIRVSHMTGLKEAIIEPMRTSRAATKPYRIEPLKPAARQPSDDPAAKWAAAYIAGVESAATSEALNTFADSKAVKLAELQEKRPELHRGCIEALDARRAALALEGGPETAPGDGFTDDQEWEA